MAFLGIPGQGEAEARRIGYQQQLDAQRSQFARQRGLALGRIGGAVSTAVGTTGNAAQAGRLAAAQAGRVTADSSNAEALAQSQMRAQQSAQEEQVRAQEMATQRQVFGGLIGGAGQVLGMAVPAFGALNGAAGGAMGAGPQQGGAVGGLGQMLVGGGSPQPTAQRTSGTIGTLGGQGPLGPTGQTTFSAPGGEAETYEERMRRLQLGGAFR